VRICELSDRSMLDKFYFVSDEIQNRQIWIVFEEIFLDDFDLVVAEPKVGQFFTELVKVSASEFAKA
jgi:hypothetical protein